LDYEEFYGVNPQPREFAKTLHGVHAGELLFAIARLIALFEDKMDVTALIATVRSRLSPRSPSHQFLSKAQRMVDQGRVPNAPQVMLNVAKHVMSYATNPLPTPRVIDDPETFSSALYLASMVSTVVGQNFSRLADVQSGVFQKGRDMAVVLQRAYECYWNLSRQRDRFYAREYVDIPVLFERVVGVNIDTFMLLLATMVLLYSPTMVDEFGFLWSDHLAKDLSDLENHFGPVSNLIVERLSVSTENFKPADDNSFWHPWEFRHFRKKPLVRIGQRYFPLYSRFLLDYISGGHPSVLWKGGDFIKVGITQEIQTFGFLTSRL
jgi:hypothetical protein